MLPFEALACGLLLTLVQVSATLVGESAKNELGYSYPRCVNMWDVRHGGQWNQRCQAPKIIRWSNY